VTAVVIVFFAVVFAALIWLVVLEVKLHRLIRQLGDSPLLKRWLRLYGRWS
jgi:hypothetical protein